MEWMKTTKNIYIYILLELTPEIVENEKIKLIMINSLEHKGSCRLGFSFFFILFCCSWHLQLNIWLLEYAIPSKLGDSTHQFDGLNRSTNSEDRTIEYSMIWKRHAGFLRHLNLHKSPDTLVLLHWGPQKWPLYEIEPLWLWLIHLLSYLMGQPHSFPKSIYHKRGENGHLFQGETDK